MLTAQRWERTRAKVVQGSMLLAFLCSCSSDPAEGGPLTTSSGGMNVGTGGTEANAGSGGAETNAGVGGTQNTGSGGAETDTGTGGSEVGTGGTEASGGTDGGETSAGSGGRPLGTGGSESSGGTGHSEAGGGSGGTTGGGGSGGTNGAGNNEITVFLAGDDVDSNGPLDTTVEENLNFSGGGHILVRPTNITSEPNTKHPVAIWGPGGGTPPTDYLQLLTRMASQGFVIVGIRESTGDSVLMSAAIDWLQEQDADSSSPMYDRLILDRVGVFGHSMGGLSSEAAALADDRVSTALLDNSGSFSHDALVNVTIPVGIIYGENGQERPNAEGDFNNPGNQGPCWLAMMAGGGHGSGPWDGAGANVSWMRWHLGGENFRKDDFIGNGGRYNDTGIWSTDFKNWEDWKNWNE